MRVEPGNAVALAKELIRIDSRNPGIDPNGPGEREVARALADVLTTWGFSTELYDAGPGRPNVVARIGQSGGRSLMFNGHLDVVGVAGMTHEPWSADERDGRIYGRGSADMKGGVAAMCAAAWHASQGATTGEIVIAAVADEEEASVGTDSLVARGIRADAAIVTEPTRLAIMPAHRGFAWFTLVFRGRAAHGSRWDIGIDAIRHAGLVLAELDRDDKQLLTARNHPLLGRPSLHASAISGGIGMTTYPDRCELTVERRSIPGESPERLLEEVRAACQRARAHEPRLNVEVELTLARGPSDVATDAPIVRALGAALQANDLETRIEGMSAWTDAAILNDAGIPAICFGPGDIALAHAAEEFVPRIEIEQATAVLTELALQWSLQ